MYLVTGKLKKEKRVYLVESNCPTVTDSLVKTEVSDEDFDISSMRKINYTDIYQLDKDGYYYNVVIECQSETDDKTIKETYLQQAESFNDLVPFFRNNVNYGEIIEIKRTEILDILTID